MKERIDPMCGERASAGLAYLGPVCLCVWSLRGRGTDFVDGHLRNGLVLLIVEAGIYLLSAFPAVPREMNLALTWAVCVFSLLGLSRALAGRDWSLPSFLNVVSRGMARV